MHVADSGLGEWDRVLGGGPGVGKSTWLLQTVATLSAQLPCLYVTGEESLEQMSLHDDRMQVNGGALRLLAEIHVEQVIAHAAHERPRVMVIDFMVMKGYSRSLNLS